VVKSSLWLIDLFQVAMKVTFPRDEGSDGKGKKRKPDWVLDISSRLTQKYIHRRCLELIDVERYKDVKAIQDEFIVEDK
jgi:hypothetical protein